MLPKNYKKNNRLITVVSILFILLLFIAVVLKKQSFTNFKPPSKTNQSVVPEPNEKPKTPDVAIPNSVRDVTGGSLAKLRTFEITAKQDSFSARKIFVYYGDTVSIRLTALDKSYDINFPALFLQQIAKQGETKILEFQAMTNGTFEFLCKTCNLKKESLTGKLIVVARS